MTPVLMGVQSRYFDDADTAKLLYGAEELTPTGASTKTAGAAGASGSGSNVIRNGDLGPTRQAILRSEIDATDLALTHKGDFRVWARIYRPASNTGAVSLRLEWAEGDYRNPALNDQVRFEAGAWEGQWLLIDLGVVHPSPESTHWEFRLLAQSTVVGDEIDVNHFMLFPTDCYGEASGLQFFETPSAFTARDEFNQTTGDLNGETAPVGGTWATSGGTTDFTVGEGSD